MSLVHQTASQILDQLKAETVSPLDLLDALESRIAEVESEVNALPTLCFERAREQAKILMQKPVSERGMLCGLPVAIKDLEPVSGVRTTWGRGSEIFSDFVPQGSDCMVELIEKNGGIIYGKTNTPEFGAGANTFNEVFGRTLNPWDVSKSCAGSSGGSAVALATGTAWLATGSDLGGSLRNPASFCSIVGFRPSPGRVPSGAASDGAYPPELGDLALFFDAMTGHHAADTLSMPKEAGSFSAALDSGWLPQRVAYSPDFGITPVDPEVAHITEKAAKQLESLGATVEEAHPDFSDVQEIFQTNRAMMFYVGQKQLLENKRELLKPEVIWNIEKARDVSMDDIERVERLRSAYLQRAVKFFDTYDLLLSPATIVSPYPVEQRFVESCNGVNFDNYIEWLTIAYAITITGFPVMSLPAGFTDDKLPLPVGLQICAGPRAEKNLLCAAAKIEEVLKVDPSVPINPRSI